MMNKTQKEIAMAAAKITEAMNIITEIGEANGMHISFEREDEDPLAELAELVSDETGYDFDVVFEVLATAADILKEVEDDE